MSANPTTTTTTIDRHLTLAIGDLSATGRSTAADRTQGIAREELDQLSAPSARRCRARAPSVALAGVPRTRRRHAVRCTLWVPPPMP